MTGRSKFELELTKAVKMADDMNVIQQKLKRTKARFIGGNVVISIAELAKYFRGSVQ